MKIQILDSRFEQAVEGYDKHIDIHLLATLASEVSNNECTYILAPEILSSCGLPQYSEVLTLMASKLRMNGEMVVGGTEIRAFADAIKQEKLDIQQSSGIIAKSQSMAKVHEVCELINSLGNFQVTWSCSGVHYEIKVRRV